MQLKLHANARTTPKTRQLIQDSELSVRRLATELGVTETTIRRWKARQNVHDASHRRHHLLASMTTEEEEVIVELRQTVRLSLNDITEVIRRCVNSKLTRSSIYRCLCRRGMHKLPAIETCDAPKLFEQTEFGYVHVDLKHLPALEKQVAYVFVAIERVSRFVYVEIVKIRDAATIASCLGRFLQSFPGKVHTILTDNGSEFTDRFAVSKIGKEPDKPTGLHPFDLCCKQYGIKHKLTKPFSPQTNGMVERFNRRLSEAIATKSPVSKNQGKNKFISHAERDQFILSFVSGYNQTRLCCLQYKTPLQTLHNHTEQYTKAGT